jgi:hypothetical protein
MIAYLSSFFLNAGPAEGTEPRILWRSRTQFTFILPLPFACAGPGESKLNFIFAPKG